MAASSSFVSDATNLVPGDNNFTDDVFRSMCRTGQIERVSVATAARSRLGYSRRWRDQRRRRWIAFSNNGDD